MLKTGCPFCKLHGCSWLGWAGYYRRFIANFSTIAAPLTALCGSRVPFVWSESCQGAFVRLRDALASEPVLRVPVKPDHPDFQPLAVHTDASDTGLGAVLAQSVVTNGVAVEHACAYISRLLSPAERNYSTGDRELLAVVWAVEKWRLLLLERHFNIITDHMALSFLMTQKNLSGRLARQAMTLQGYSFTIRHRPGVAHANADGLSRLRFMPEEMSICMSTILGNDVESVGWYSQLVDCWRNVAVEVLPVNRPTQALRDTGNSCLAFTRGQLGIVEVGDPGQRLGLLEEGPHCLVVTRGKNGSAVGVPRAVQQMDGQGSHPAPSVGSAAVVEGSLAVQRMGVPQGLSPGPSGGSAAAGLAKEGQLKFHEEIWLSGAVNLLRSEPNCAPARWARKLEEQSKKYRIIFGPGGAPWQFLRFPWEGGW